MTVETRIVVEKIIPDDGAPYWMASIGAYHATAPYPRVALNYLLDKILDAGLRSVSQLGPK